MKKSELSNIGFETIVEPLQKNQNMGGCNPDRVNPCEPDRTGCAPCNPNVHCGPNDCRPVR